MNSEPLWSEAVLTNFLYGFLAIWKGATFLTSMSTCCNKDEKSPIMWKDQQRNTGIWDAIAPKICRSWSVLCDQWENGCWNPDFCTMHSCLVHSIVTPERASEQSNTKKPNLRGQDPEPAVSTTSDGNTALMSMYKNQPTAYTGPWGANTLPSGYSAVRMSWHTSESLMWHMASAPHIQVPSVWTLRGCSNNQSVLLPLAWETDWANGSWLWTICCGHVRGELLDEGG